MEAINNTSDLATWNRERSVEERRNLISSRLASLIDVELDI